jgi:hypothetical protein
MPEAEDLEKTVPSSPRKSKSKIDAAETQRVGVEAAVETPQSKPRRSRLRWIIGLVVAFIVILGLGALAGMQAGIYARQVAENREIAVEAETQFQLAIVNLQNGECDLARQRLEYITQLNPDFPGLLDHLTQAMLCATGGPAVSDGAAAATATPDLRGVEQAYSDAQAQLSAQNWDQLLLTLDTLRTNYPDYQPIEVDRMYYTALRNRGVSRILPTGDLEGGIYDLNRAAKIGPLDSQAENYRQWAIAYIVGQSFWEIDWEQAVAYFQPLAAAAPSIHDLNFFTAQDRLAAALAGYALDLIDQADRFARDKQWCSAAEMMNQSNGYTPLSPEAQVTATYYSDKCALNGDEPQ